MFDISKNKKLITPDNDCFQYMGRIDFEHPERPMFIWAGSTASVKFTGTSCAAVLLNIPFQEVTHFGAVIDGVMHKYIFGSTRDEVTVTLAEGLPEGEHTLQIIKTMAAHNYFEFRGLYIDENAEALPFRHNYDLKLEVYGDSVSAGEVVEALYNEGQIDPENHQNKYDNAYYAYPMILSRMLNAEVYDIAQGGIALLDGTGFFCADNLTGMESVYDKLAYTPYFERKQWDFSKYTPDIVIMAIGQNDSAPDPERIKAPEYRRMWKDKYIALLNTLMDKYPNAKFILTLTVLGHDFTWEAALDEIHSEVNNPRVLRFRFTRTGRATLGHPRATEQAEMATELAAYISKIQNND